VGFLLLEVIDASYEAAAAITLASLVDGGVLLTMSKGVLSVIYLILNEAPVRQKVAIAFHIASCGHITAYINIQ